MACYHPIPAFQDQDGAPVRLWPPVGTATVELPCGSCVGCKTDRAAEWARRAEHEASCWKHNCFLTLTYKEAPGELVPADLQAFLKRLRRHIDRRNPVVHTLGRRGLRYLGCGEYGDRTGRPHYHLLLFNCGFADAYQVGKDLYESPLINQLWPQGAHRLGQLTGGAANYVAQYTLKKIGRAYADADGVQIQSPFLRMSTRPAIGFAWLEKHKTDCRHGFIIQDGQKRPIPRAYKKQLKKLDGQLAEQAQFNTQQKTKHKEKPNLQAAETIHKRKLQLAHARTL